MSEFDNFIDGEVCECTYPFEEIGHLQCWIPVGERLPKFGQDVLLSLRSLDIKTGFRAET